uniref:Respiratory nitrate reductase subunit n=2 Tax=Ralstonia solanacearum TaxID=305 RepID=A0A0S4TWU7_RALSL|nr:Respiratory nitrate reductase subunit [Ralstonia solanacearum]
MPPETTMTQPSLYHLLSALLAYPEPELLDALPEIDRLLSATPDARRQLAPLLDTLRGTDLITLQEHYVATFDRNPSHALHLFEHVHGESRDRGQAMVDLIEEYRKYGVEPAANELPDYVPLFLEVLGHMETTGHGEQATALLGDAIHVLAAVGERLARDGTSYAAVFDVLLTRSDVQPQPLTEPPIRDMDEAMEHFGPGADGVEPLLRPAPAAEQPVQFHPRKGAAAHPTPL